ncbi:MAG: urocanate hydratase [Bacteroidetes bacterium]|nr:urocanate hydratase [Bacteroidota bacterium]
MTTEFAQQILEGIPDALPPAQEFDPSVSHAPIRKDLLSEDEKIQALFNALRYFPQKHHDILAKEFLDELRRFGRIYMYRFRPHYVMRARPISEYPHQSKQAAAIMLMIQNNLDPAVAQHPHELITYGGNGAVFQNWAQYRLTMKYLATMTDEQTLHMYSGHPMGLFPSSKESPRVVVTNGMMIPNYSKPDDWERFNALGVTQYGQMTAGSYMYIGPQGIVHGTNITILNAGRKISKAGEGLKGKLFLTSGLGGMSGAQPKAGNIAGCITVVAEVNDKATFKRHEQGWVDEVFDDLNKLVSRVKAAKINGEIVSLAFRGNIVEVWEKFDQENIFVDIGSDQTSLHNPWAGGYYPVGLTFEKANQLMVDEPDAFKIEVKKSLVRQAAAINRHTAKGTYFFDYGNAFLLEAYRSGAEVMLPDQKTFRYPSYVQDIMGPMCFDYGFGPFRWVCASGTQEDLDNTDAIASAVLQRLLNSATPETSSQLKDNLLWINQAKTNKLVVGSKARILYADTEGRIEIAKAFNQAIAQGQIGPVILGRDHHDVSGTDSPYRETSNIYDGSKFTADMAVHNFVGDSFRGATWISLHNGGGVGWGEVINGGFGLFLDGTKDASDRAERMLSFDVQNGLARRAWAGNKPALFTTDRMMKEGKLQLTRNSEPDRKSIEGLFRN